MSKGNEPAFASVWKPSEQQAHWGHKEVMHSGLTKREYFAGLAMQGLCANGAWLQAAIEHSTDVPGAVADAARDIADALLAELEKTA